ncbi:DUF2294 domain-containing protein [Paenalcaligenes niemegkensis]|uniref:DUF2294 domain-containing protein n=1 Tax=Paenalcaligenes niemegkensis TaxID=2895469 RepID=UPI001EE7E2AF|nr:DUF2294 domain-containing protein [Paenalcaligenes niemegkensis]MCQ9617743.1 DUF2294 domain-containing protein [Paenalcaligenes niemegkensis]
MSLQKFVNMGELKQALTRDYNKINSKIFSSGVVTLKIEIFEEKIFMLAVHKRLVSLDYLSKESKYVSDLADYYLIKAFKQEMREVLTQNYGFNVSSIFKDYDSVDELSSTLVLLKESVQKYLG